MRGGADLLSALPDDILQHVLSFIPTRESVRASLLSRRWRHIWRSTPALRADEYAKGRGDAFAMFINRFLLLRDRASPLRFFKMDLVVSDGGGDKHQEDAVFDDHVDLWIRHAALTCCTLALAASPTRFLLLTGQPLAASRNLTKLKLCCVSLADGFLDLSRCPALLKLTLGHCYVDCEAIVSPSLHRLSFIECCFISTTTTRISTPSLRRLHLSDCRADAHPSFESMPSLTTAIVCLPEAKRDSRDHWVLLHGLSEAQSLELKAPCSGGQDIFQRDLRWCPTFSNLKTLILNEWCVYADATELDCLLRHSPILENIIFEVPTYYGPDPQNTNQSYTTLERPTFEHLKMVEIKFHHVICSGVF